jgi:hypothetical protein
LQIFIAQIDIKETTSHKGGCFLKLMDYLSRKRNTAAPRATMPRRTSGRTPPKKYTIAISRNKTIMNQVAILVGNFIIILLMKIGLRLSIEQLNNYNPDYSNELLSE